MIGTLRRSLLGIQVEEKGTCCEIDWGQEILGGADYNVPVLTLIQFN